MSSPPLVWYDMDMEDRAGANDGGLQIVVHNSYPGRYVSQLMHCRVQTSCSCRPGKWLLLMGGKAARYHATLVLPCLQEL